MLLSNPTQKRFIEIASVAGSVRVDRNAGILYGVKLCGIKSKNGREYPPQTLREAVGKYDARHVYVNHPRMIDRGEDRDWNHWAGVICNPRFKVDGIYGDIQLRKESKYFGEICEAAEKWPNCFGCSHVADGDSDYHNGVESVNRINEVASVDLVMDPATTGGLFESSTVAHGPYVGTHDDTQPGSTPLPCQSHALDVIHGEFDRWMVDALRDVTLAYHNRSEAPLSELSARLHVLVNETAWFFQLKDGKPNDSEKVEIHKSPLWDVVSRLDVILLDPTQTAAIPLAEKELMILANLLHKRTAEDVTADKEQAAFDRRNAGGGKVGEPGPFDGKPTRGDGGTVFDESQPPRWQPWMEQRIDNFDPNFHAKVRERDRYESHFHSGLLDASNNSGGYSDPEYEKKFQEASRRKSN